MARKDEGQTLELPGIPKRRGRPVTGCAMTNAERQRKYRKSHKSVDAGETMSATITRLAKAFDLTESQVTRHLLRFALCNKNWMQSGFPLSDSVVKGGGK